MSGKVSEWMVGGGERRWLRQLPSVSSRSTPPGATADPNLIPFLPRVRLVKLVSAEGGYVRLNPARAHRDDVQRGEEHEVHVRPAQVGAVHGQIRRRQ